MSKEDFDLFWKTHLVTPPQGCNVPDVTVLYWHIAKEEISNFPWTRRDGTFKSHATAAAVRDLMTQVRVATRKIVLKATLFQNYSPCSRCVEEVLKTLALAKEKRIKLDISIAFVALKGIRRPSWTWRGLETAFHRVTINESNDNSFALRQLRDAGVKLSTFNPNTWQFLYTFLGNGLPVENPGKFLGGKCPNVESRLDEDRFMEADLKQVLRGLSVTSLSISSSNSVLNIDWCKPGLTGEKISEYKVVCKKVIVKNREDEDRSWRIQQVVDNVGVKISVPGELTSFQMSDFELDTFYDVTVEAMVKGLSTCTGRKLFRTGSKAPIPSLQSPAMTRKLSSCARSRISSSSALNNVAVPASVARLIRSSSVNSAAGSLPQARFDFESDARDSAEKVTVKMSASGAERKRISVGGGLDRKATPSSVSRGLYRSSSLSSTTMDRPLANSQDFVRRKLSETRKPSNSVTKGSTTCRKTSTGSSIGGTRL